MILATWRLRYGRLKFEASPGKRVHEIPQNNQSKIDWRCGSSGRAPALQAQTSVFTSQSHQKNQLLLLLAGVGGCL
jgi:hypothetical protein